MMHQSQFRKYNNFPFPHFLNNRKKGCKKRYKGGNKDNAVKPIQNPPMPRDQLAEIFYMAKISAFFIFL